MEPPVADEIPDERYRPVQYTVELGNEFCRRMASGNCLTRLVKKHKDMPTWKTLQKWLAGYPEFKKEFDLAREALYDYWADETIEIADTTQDGQVVKEGPLGVEVTTSDMLGHRKLRIDARKWLLSKLAKHKFGEKVDLNLAGQPGGAPIQYEDIRDHNLGLLDAISARLAGPTASTPATPRTGAGDSEPESGSDA